MGKKIDKSKQDYKNIWAKTCTLPWCTLVTTGRTGTDFFQSLLDSHPNVFVYNGSLYFHTFWESALTVQHSQNPILSDFLDEFIGANLITLKSHYESLERKDQLGESRDCSIDIDTKQFKTHVSGLLETQTINAKNALTAIYVAYALCIGQDISQKKLFFHHVHHVRKVDRYIADFPDSKIICMTRDPRAMYVSGVENWRKFNKSTDNPSYPLYILWRAVDEISHLTKYKDGRLKVLKMEDLAEEKTLHAVCQWLNIEFNPCLKEATWAGLRWWGDQISQNQIPDAERGYSKTIATNRWEKGLKSIDKALLNYLLIDQLEWYGYPCHRQRGPIIAILMAFAILFPTVYERRYLTPQFLLRVAAEKKPLTLIRSFYHPLLRIIQYYKWFYRRNFGTYYGVEYINFDCTRQRELNEFV